MDAIDRNLLFGQVADNRVGHVLRVLDASLSTDVGVTGNLNYVSLLSLKLGSDLAEGVFRLGVQRGLAGAEANLGVIYFLVLVEIGNRGVQLAGVGARLHGRLIRLARGAARGRCGLVGLVGGGLRLMNAGLCAGIRVLDVIGVLGLELVELVQATLGRVKLPVYPLLAGKRIHVTPESLFGPRLERLAGCVRAVVPRVGAVC